MNNYGGARKPIPKEIREAVHAWDARRKEIGGVKQALARWRKLHKEHGTELQLANRLGISRRAVVDIIARRRETL